MPKIIFLLIAVILAILIFRYFNQKLASTAVNINNQKFYLEIASTAPQQATGLSNRKELCDNCGMIFVFGSEGTYPFWMKDTLIPLDMIWLDQSGKVVTILTAQPEPNTSILSLKRYINVSPAKYVIEINANMAQKIGLKTGDTVTLPIL